MRRHACFASRDIQSDGSGMFLSILFVRTESIAARARLPPGPRPALAAIPSRPARDSVGNRPLSTQACVQTSCLASSCNPSRIGPVRTRPIRRNSSILRPLLRVRYSYPSSFRNRSRSSSRPQLSLHDLFVGICSLSGRAAQRARLKADYQSVSLAKGARIRWMRFSSIRPNCCSAPRFDPVGLRKFNELA